MATEGNSLSHDGLSHHKDKNESFSISEWGAACLPWSEVHFTYIKYGHYETKLGSLAKHSLMRGTSLIVVIALG